MRGSWVCKSSTLKVVNGHPSHMRQDITGHNKEQCFAVKAETELLWFRLLEVLSRTCSNKKAVKKVIFISMSIGTNNMKRILTDTDEIHHTCSKLDVQYTCKISPSYLERLLENNCAKLGTFFLGHPVDRYYTSFSSCTGTRRLFKDQGHTSSEAAAITEVVFLLSASSDFLKLKINSKTWRKKTFYMKSHLENYVVTLVEDVTICLMVTTVRWAVVAYCYHSSTTDRPRFHTTTILLLLKLCNRVISCPGVDGRIASSVRSMVLDWAFLRGHVAG